MLPQHPEQTCTVYVYIGRYWIIGGGCPQVDYGVLCVPLFLLGLLLKEVAVSLQIVDGSLDPLIEFALQFFDGVLVSG